MICLGIECTAHTFGVGIINDKGDVLANARDMFVPPQGGINPLDAMNHHIRVKEAILERALQEAGLELKDIDIFAYSAGPGLPPCLKVGSEFVAQIANGRPVIEVNHCVAHIEIGRIKTGAKDPIVVYVSGGNTQVIGYASGRYRVFGETQDIPVGNAIDVFVRETYGKDRTAESFGGPIIEKHAEGGSYIELPYVVKGMDLSFSGIMTAAVQKYEKLTAGKNQHEKDKIFSNLAFSFQETCYAMLTEVTERALAHTGKSEVMLVGGVAASRRFREMMEKMCQERGAQAFVVPKEYSGDQGVMIAWTGILSHKHGQLPTKKADFNSVWRTDQVEIKWM